MPGPQDTWVQPQFGDPLYLGGLQLAVTPAGYAKEPAVAPASVIRMADGRGLVQVPYLDPGKAEGRSAFYRFAFRHEALAEDDWWKLLAAAKGPAPLDLIDFGAEVEVFVAGPELASFTLPRPSAVSVWPSFPVLAYPSRAFLDGVELTEVTTAPAATEFRLTGSLVEVATLTAGQVLGVRYYPAYSVAAESVPAQRLQAHQQLDAEVVLVEARA